MNMQQIVRECMMEAKDPDCRQEVLALVEEQMKTDGYDSERNFGKDVDRGLIRLRAKYGRPLTHKKIQSGTQRDRAEASSPSIRQVIRDCLLQFEDPGRADRMKVAAMARARCEQLGIPGKQIDRNRVSIVIYEVRDRFGEPVTRELIARMNERVASGGFRKRTVRSVAAPTAARRTTRPPKERSYGLSLIQQAIALARDCGSSAEAVELLRALEGGL